MRSWLGSWRGIRRGDERQKREKERKKGVSGNGWMDGWNGWIGLDWVWTRLGKEVFLWCFFLQLILLFDDGDTARREQLGAERFWSYLPYLFNEKMRKLLFRACMYVSTNQSINPCIKCIINSYQILVSWYLGLLGRCFVCSYVRIPPSSQPSKNNSHLCQIGYSTCK